MSVKQRCAVLDLRGSLSLTPIDCRLVIAPAFFFQLPRVGQSLQLVAKMEGSSLSPEMRQKRSYFNGVPTRAPGNRCCDEVTEVCLAREDEMGPFSKSSFWEAKGWVRGWDEERKLTPTFFFVLILLVFLLSFIPFDRSRTRRICKRSDSSERERDGGND